MRNLRDYLPVLLQIIVMLIAGVWVVASVQSTTLVLGAQLTALTASITELKMTITLQSEQIQHNRADISEIKGRMDHGPR